MAKVVNPIPDWDKKQNTCFFCKSNESVKYMLCFHIRVKTSLFAMPACVKLQ